MSDRWTRVAGRKVKTARFNLINCTLKFIHLTAICNRIAINMHIYTAYGSAHLNNYAINTRRKRFDGILTCDEGNGLKGRKCPITKFVS